MLTQCRNLARIQLPIRLYLNKELAEITELDQNANKMQKSRTDSSFNQTIFKQRTGRDPRTRSEQKTL